MYVACCKSLREARAIQNQIIAAAPTLIYSRLLMHSKDLDVFSAEMLRSGDEQIAVGAFAFGNNQATMNDSWRIFSKAVLLAVILLGMLAVAGVRLLTSTAHSNTLVGLFAVALLLLFIFFAYLGTRAVARMTPERTAFWNAAKWLKRGRPVMIAASEEPIDEKISLPENVLCFYRASDQSYRRPA